MSENQPAKTITVRWLSERGIQTDVFAKDIFFSWRAKNKVLVSYIKLIMFAEFRAKGDYMPI